MRTLPRVAVAPIAILIHVVAGGRKTSAFTPRTLVPADITRICALSLKVNLPGLVPPIEGVGEISFLRRSKSLLASRTGATNGEEVMLSAPTAISRQVIPRAAVSIVLRVQTGPKPSSIRYALVQRGKEPNRGLWSFPGGKVEAGESTMDAAKRELWEETRMGVFGEKKGDGSTTSNLLWHADGPFTATDSIHRDSNKVVQFHYVISQCFAEALPMTEKDDLLVLPKLVACDDAMDARWWNIEEMEQGIKEGNLTPGILRVLDIAETFYDKGLFKLVA